MKEDYIDISKLNLEMCYEPSWPEDRPTFVNLIRDVQLEDLDNIILVIARLHIRYQHIIHRKEIQKCFIYLLSQVKCSNIEDLYNLAYSIYNKYD
jgi:hypothetical protein